jgi:hypothetical protein
MHSLTRTKLALSLPTSVTRICVMLPSPWPTTSEGHVEDESPLAKSMPREPIPTLFPLPLVPPPTFVYSRARYRIVEGTGTWWARLCLWRGWRRGGL